MPDVIDTVAARLASLPSGCPPTDTAAELPATFERLARAPAPDHEQGTLISVAALAAELAGLRELAASAARLELERVTSRARHALNAEGQAVLPSRYVLDLGMRTYDAIADLVRRDERTGLRQRATELLGLSLVAAEDAEADRRRNAA
ncbi:MAG TPA: hypothetical protein VF587_05130 [Solirubrobacteraceae bacterium]|jgi:hypothetical protein